VVARAAFDYNTASGFTRQQLYATASYKTKDLHGVNFRGASTNLAGWDLAGQNLSQAYFDSADLTGTTLADANAVGASFYRTTLAGATLTNANLTGAAFDQAILRGATLRGANLTSASCSQADLTGAVLAQANLTGASLASATLANADFTGACCDNADLTSAALIGADLTNASFRGATLTNTDFIDAVIEGACLDDVTLGGFTPEQLYSTASYQTGKLDGIRFNGCDLAGWSFAGQSLTNASFGSATLTNTSFRMADLRGASLADGSGTSILDNAILTDSRITGLQLARGDMLVVRDDPNALPINVQNTFVMAEGSLLKMVLFDDVFRSTIDVAGGVVPVLNGTLQLTCASNIDVTTLAGRPFTLFNWNGQLPAGRHFSAIQTSPGLAWDISELYTTGVVTAELKPSPSAALAIQRCTVLPGSASGVGTVILNGFLPDCPSSLNHTLTVHFAFGPFQQSIPASQFQRVGAMYLYRGRSGGVGLLLLNPGQRSFMFQAQNINLGGLVSPAAVDVTLGDYRARAEASLQNLSMAFLRGYRDALRVDSAQVTLSSLVLRGALAVRNTTAKLSRCPVTISWGDQAFTIPAGSFVKTGTAYRYMDTRGLNGKVYMATIDLERCTFFVIIRNANIEQRSGAVAVSMAFESFSQTYDYNWP
jgi:uncharacterized protein YjbI with pentapeptide repeats